MSRRSIIILISLVLAFGFVAALPALAQVFDLSQGIVGNLPAGCRLRGDCNFCDFIQLFVVLQKVILSLFGGLALIMLIWGGQSMITAAGNSQKIAEAKKLIFSTLLGVLIILVAYFLITILVAILVTPASKTLDKSLFGRLDWTQAFCPSPADTDYCQDQADGTSCIYKDSLGSGAGNCKDGSCISACLYQYGTQSYSCKPEASCTDPNNIVSGLCTDSTYVCCK